MFSNRPHITENAKAGAVFFFLLLLGATQAEASGVKPRFFIIKHGEKVICIEITKEVCINCKSEAVPLDGYKPEPTDEPCPTYDPSKEKDKDEPSNSTEENPKPKKGRKQASGK
jgi:hypothetical protein